MGVILDTSEFIFAERHGLTFDELLSVYRPEEPAVSVITLAEMKHGIRRAQTVAQRTRRESYLTKVIDTLVVFPVTTDVALLIGNLDAELEMRGEKIALADLTIAATALTTQFAIATRNVRHFRRIDGLNVISPDLHRR